MDNCNSINQYYSDVTDGDGKIVPGKCFKGGIYKEQPKFNLNSYLNYNSKDYYSWINKNFKDYSFEQDYSLKTFDDICGQTKEYSLKPQQKFAGRIFNTLTDNKGILIYHGLGSGKTQTSIIIGEAFKFRNVKTVPVGNVVGNVVGNTGPGSTSGLGGQVKESDIIQPARADTIVLIVVPASLVEQYYSAIIGFVEDDTIKSASGQILIAGERQFYLNKKLRNAIDQNNKSIKQLEDRINTNPDNKQKLMSQITSLKLENRDRYDQERKKVNKVYEIMSHEKFLNRLFKKKGTDFEEGEYLEYLQKKNGLLIIDEAHGLVSGFGTSYRKLLMAIKYYANPEFKVVLLTGSPIYDKPFEFGLLMNLLRPRVPFPDGFEKFNNVFIDSSGSVGVFKNAELFKKMCSGYVSYFKGGNPEAYPYKKIIIMNHQMGTYQYDAYKTALFKEIERDKDTAVDAREDFLVRISTTENVDDLGATSVFNNSRLFCNIAFPEVRLPASNRKKRIELGLAELKKELVKVKPDQVTNFIKQYSSKFSKVAELIEMSDGPVFVYSNYVPYGVDSMAMIMNAIGYSAYPSKGLKGSYFVWKGSADENEVKKANMAFNSPKNITGSLLKIMFGTQSVMEGVDFKRVRQIHVLDPWWNDSRMQQVIARGIRFCSHSLLPPDKQKVDVFIHLSTLGAGATLYRLKYQPGINDTDIGGNIKPIKKVYSMLQRINEREDNESKWIFREAFVNSEGEIIESKQQFNASQIISGTIEKLADPMLTKKIGRWKNMDSTSVEQYMYNKAMKKLKLNRSFEMAVKEVSIDCKLNTNGNIIRLEEHYLPDPRNDVFKLEYLNYSNGKRYNRIGVKSVYNPELHHSENPDESFLSLEDIINDTARKSTSTEFKDTETGEVVKFPKSLIINEDISCSDGDYSFKGVPKEVSDLTINNELIKYLKKLSVDKFKQFFFDVEHSHVQVSDPKLAGKIRKFYSKQAVNEKQELIEKLQEIGIGVDENVWDFYTLDDLKKIAYKIFKKK